MTELAGLEKHIVTVGDLEVVAKLTDHVSKHKNGAASREEFRRGTHVGEYGRTWCGNRAEGVFGEGFWECTGSLVVAGLSAMFLHHKADREVSRGGLWGNVGDVKRMIGSGELSSGASGVIWRRDSGKEHRSYGEATDQWVRELLKLYQEYGINVALLSFRGWEWPMSAYFDGGNRLTLTGNWLDKGDLFNPNVDGLKGV